ncbi:MAG TPA: alpha/beta hydrolase-fold protein [Deinococcales bacterium]|nr:alpha/beta hydrolase-fold protein [Deinococcales bacterium]
MLRPLAAVVALAVLALPGLPARAAGDFLRLKVPAPASLGGERAVTVLLPESYTLSETRYPVVYFQDGQNIFNPASPSYSLWDAVTALAGLAQRGRVVIAVAVDFADRNAEYTPHPDAANGLPVARGAAYADWLAGTLKPFVDARLRTLTGPQDTALAGSSLGGLISLYAWARHRDVFGKVAALSPSVWVANRAVLADLQAVPAGAGAGARVYLVAGALEPDSVTLDARDAAAILEARGASAKLVVWPNGVHHETAWARELPGALAYLFLP